MNLLDYVYWRGDLDFAASPFNVIDALLFSQLVYLDFTGIVSPRGRGKNLGNALRELYARTPKESMNLGVIVPKEIVELGDRVRTSARYQSLRVHDFVKDLDFVQKKQFSAMTIDLSAETSVVIYSGTDDSLIGWQENLNMLDTFPVPSEVSALSYLEYQAKKNSKKKLYVAGHSKGGTLALYASMYFSRPTRISQVWNFDGPFIPEEKFSQIHFKQIDPLFWAVLPENSIIGKLFGLHGRHLIVSSDAAGLYQHNAFSWQLKSTHFVTTPRFTDKSEEIAQAISKILSSMSLVERQQFTENIYALIRDSNADTLFDISRSKMKTFFSIRRLSRVSRTVLTELIKLFIKYGLISRQEEHVKEA